MIKLIKFTTLFRTVFLGLSKQPITKLSSRSSIILLSVTVLSLVDSHVLKEVSFKIEGQEKYN